MKQATSLGAELIEMSGERNRHREGPLGVLQVGAYADLVIVDGNLERLDAYEQGLCKISKQLSCRWRI